MTANDLNIGENLKELILFYDGIHRWKSISQQESKDRLEEMQMEINTVKELIKRELKK